MNKIGEISLENQIKMLDAFDFIEQYDVVQLSNIEPGLWLAFDDYVESDEDEEYGINVSNVWLVNAAYLAQNNDMKNYAWERHDNIISIEKGVIGIYNDSFSMPSTYYGDLEKALASIYQDNKDYLAYSTPFGNDGYFAFDTVQDNGKIVAIRIDLEELS